jgi:hypothetical protein
MLFKQQLMSTVALIRRLTRHSYPLKAIYYHVLLIFMQKYQETKKKVHFGSVTANHVACKSQY